MIAIYRILSLISLCDYISSYLLSYLSNSFTWTIWRCLTSIMVPIITRRRSHTWKDCLYIEMGPICFHLLWTWHGLHYIDDKWASRCLKSLATWLLNNLPKLSKTEYIKWSIKRKVVPCHDVIMREALMTKCGSLSIEKWGDDTSGF